MHVRQPMLLRLVLALAVAALGLSTAAVVLAIGSQTGASPGTSNHPATIRYASVPSVVGQQRGAALSRFDHLGLRVMIQMVPKTGTAIANTVVAVLPAPGSRLVAGSLVTVRVARSR